MKIAFVISSIRGGGAEQALARISSGLAERGHSIYIYLLKRTDDEYPISNKVKVSVYGDSKKSAFIGKIKRIRNLNKLMKENEIDIVVPFSPIPAEDAYFASFGLKTKFINTVRNNPWVYPDSKWERMRRDLFVKKADFCVFQTEEQRKYFEKYDIKSQIIYNPVAEEFLSVNREYKAVRRIVTLGRLESQKNHAMLINAFALSNNDNLVLEIYGEGSEKANLENLIRRLGMKEKVLLKGRTNNPIDVLSKADLFVLSSDYEGMPNALIEAMATGLPCISTDCPTGPAQLIQTGTNGILVPVNNIDEMKNAIDSVVFDPLKAQEIGENARSTISKWCSLENILDSWQDVFDSILSN
ncbi:MAG: glycosyltransferase family 4 protein [Oscillospiraceae bacterium]|nr:glycosyltransferase family 4 protein [Oscillospiraceae bacterium]